MGFRKIQIGPVKTTTRIRKGVKQTIKLFDKYQRRTIIQQVVKGKTKYGLRITDVLDMYGVSPVVYHSWVRKNDTNVNEHVRFTIKVKSGIDLLKFTDKLREIEEIEKVGILS